MSEKVQRKVTASAASDEISGADEKEESVKRAAEKKCFRLAALEKRDSLTAEQRRDYSDRIVKNLTDLPYYRNADALLTYISFRSEADTFSLIEKAFADGKAVFAPKVMGKEMDFFHIFSMADLAKGYQGILEPTGGQKFDEWIVDRLGRCVGRRQEKPTMTEDAEECDSAALSAFICLPGCI